MEINIFLAFTVGWIASFLGTLPFGPINLSVVDTTINRSFRAALWMALAAAIVEIVQSFIALHCSMFINDYLQNSPIVKVAALILFLGLGLAFFFKKASQNKPEQENTKGNSFIKGFFIALVNPQAIPFWIFVLAYLDTAQMIHLDSHLGFQVVIGFLLGVSIGKFCALLLFGLLSRFISNKTTTLNLWMNKIIGSILILIALIQGINYLT